MLTDRQRMKAAREASRVEAAVSPPQPNSHSFPFPAHWTGGFNYDNPPPVGARVAGGWMVDSRLLPFAGIVAHVNPDRSFLMYCREGLLPCKPGHPWQWASVVYGSYAPADRAFVYAQKLKLAGSKRYRETLASALDGADDEDVKLALSRRPRGPKPPPPSEPERRLEILRENAWYHHNMCEARRTAAWLQKQAYA